MKFQSKDNRITVEPDSGHTSHTEIFEVLNEANALAVRAHLIMPVDSTRAEIAKLVDACDQTAAQGKTDAVRTLLQDVDQSIADSEATLVQRLFMRSLPVFIGLLVIGAILVALWYSLGSTQFWLNFEQPWKFNLNVIFQIGGWYGFTVLGFSFGWLFHVLWTCRRFEADALTVLQGDLRRRLILWLWFLMLTLVLILFLFQMGGLKSATSFIRMLLIDPPGALFLGLIAGFTEKAIIGKLRGTFKVF